MSNDQWTVQKDEAGLESEFWSLKEKSVKVLVLLSYPVSCFPFPVSLTKFLFAGKHYKQELRLPLPHFIV